MTITQLLDIRAEECGARTLIVCDDEEHTYAEVRENAARFAMNLSARGVGKGDKILLLMGNCMEFLYCFLGAGRIGAVLVPVNPLLKPDEIAYIANDSDAETLVIVPQFAAFLPQLKTILPKVKHVFVLGDGPETSAEGAEPFSAFLEPVDAIPEPAVSDEDDAALIYTSGTTGQPKGVELTHRNYIANARMLTRLTAMGETDRFLLVLPLFHVNSQVVSLLAPITAGATVILTKKFNPFTIVPMIEKHRATIMSAVPTIYNVMCRMPKAADYDVSSIRFFVSGAAPMPDETYKDVQRVLKKPLIMGYGLSEATCASAGADYRDPIKWNSVGCPLRYTGIRIVGEDGVDVPIGEVGEILVSGPAVMKGYYKNPEATKDVLQGGWLRTGDQGRFDEDGYLYIVGRVKDMIIRGGQNVYPQQVENAISKLAGVEECCVVGIEEERWGQEILAVIKVAEGHTLDEEQVMAHCRETLAGYKCPRHVRFVEELPKTATGKIRKVEVAAQFADIAKS
ncbi:MAG: long-chain-fatty-acid--CoA ligase [bacterium]|nr:long-chain-fatty-acid--CoA ligase [bacterium]